MISEKREIKNEKRKETKKTKNSKIIQKIQLTCAILCCLFMIGIALSLIIKYYAFSEYEYIWFCSKILTVKSIVNKTINSDLVFSHISNGESIYFNNHYIDYLGRIEEDGTCLKSYKKCGILDTYGNSFCMSPNDVCPINKIIYDLKSENSKYQKNNYEYYETDHSNVYLFYKRDVLDSGIIASWIKGNSWPKYIDKKNIILDKNAFKEYFKLKDYEDDVAYQSYLNKIIGKELFNNAYDYIKSIPDNYYDLDRIKKLVEFIIDKIKNDENNLDYSYTYINKSYYVKNYMGFENLEAMNNFNKIDFNVYKKKYPNKITLVFSFLIICAFVVFTFALIVYFSKKETIKFHLAFVIIFAILYISYFLYLFIYSIIFFIRVFRNENFKIAKSIKADKYIEDFLREFYTPFDKIGFIICIILVLLISFMLFILFWIIEPISKCKLESKQIKSIETTNK